MKKYQPHKNIPEGCFEEEQGQGGFYGPVSHLIKKEPSTRWVKIEGPLKPRLFDLTKGKKTWNRVLFNEYLSINFFHCEENKATSLFRNADGDLLYFCHKGEGVILTEYGLLNYSSSQYILIPKCIAHVFLPAKTSDFFVVESLKSHFQSPNRGLLGRHGLYSPSSLIRPDLKALKKFLEKERREFKTITVHKNGEKTNFIYDTSVFDVVDWTGDLFPFTLHTDDIMPIGSHRVHLPPSAHTTFVTDEFIICSFLPRPLEEDKDALKVPFYHQNMDYDEVLFYHKGDFFSRDNLKPGMMSFHPSGFPHGPHPKAVQNITEKKRTNEYAVMVDSRYPLQIEKSFSYMEDTSYSESWK